MKNRKNVFVLAIVALILVLGVGYATITATSLTINGTAAAKDQALKVVYDGVNTKSTNVTQQTAADGSTAATFTVTDMVMNTEEYAEFEIKNKDQVSATIKKPTAQQLTNSNSEYFNVTLYYNDTVWDGDQTLAPNATAKIKVVVSLAKEPDTLEHSSTTISVTYDAIPVLS